jgi:DNA-directed RNA polymerase specialized sigma24 family protein
MPHDLDRWRAYAAKCASNLNMSLDDREDAICEAILAILESPISADPYIRTLTANAIRGHYKRLQQQSMTVDIPEPSQGSENAVIEAVYAQQVYDELDSDDQEIVKMDLHGFTEREIATELDLTIKQVESRKRKFRKKLEGKERANNYMYDDEAIPCL